MMHPADRLNAMMATIQEKQDADAAAKRSWRYQTAEDRKFQLYVTPVEARTRPAKPHFRTSYYMLDDKQQWTRTSQRAFMKAMRAEYDQAQLA